VSTLLPPTGHADALRLRFECDETCQLQLRFRD